MPRRLAGRYWSVAKFLRVRTASHLRKMTVFLKTVVCIRSVNLRQFVVEISLRFGLYVSRFTTNLAGLHLHGHMQCFAFLAVDELNAQTLVF